MTDNEKLEFLYGEFGNVNCIKRELYSSSENAVAIGFYLNEIEKREFWKATKFYKDFKSEQYTTKSGIIKYTEYTFFNYCHDEFNFSRRSVDRYINIYFAFAKIQNGCRTKFIDDQYKDYNCSQLSEMLGLSDKARAAVSPDMSVKDIRKVKKQQNSPLTSDAGDNMTAADEAPAAKSDGKSTVRNNADNDNVITFVNKPEAIAPEDVNIVLDRSWEAEDKIFKKKNIMYVVCCMINLSVRRLNTPSSLLSFRNI